jgi:hypothetical protein
MMNHTTRRIWSGRSARLAALPTTVATLALAEPALAAGTAPAGRYHGTQKQGADGGGSAHRVWFQIVGGQLRKLVIGAGQSYCSPPVGRRPGFAPGYFTAPSPRLSGFPAVKLHKRGQRYYVKVTYTRTGGRWRINPGRHHKNGPGYLTLAGYLSGKRFVPVGTRNLEVRYGADATGTPTFAPGVQECSFAGKLSAHKS